MVRTLHLVKTELLPSRQNFAGRETNASISLEEVLGDGTSATGLRNLVIITVVDGRILRFELLNQGVDVLVLILILGDLGRQISLLAVAVLLLLVLRVTGQ